MTLGDKIIQLRKEKGFSQEQLAQELNVSRQAVSKWEVNQSVPEISKLIALADLFKISIDNLVRDELELYETRSNLGYEKKESENRINNIYYNYNHAYEYKSKRTLWGLPLVHIHTGSGFRVAKGIIAIGNISIGVVSIGGLSFGLCSLGGLSMGLLVSLGGVSLGSLALGGLAIGGIALGGVAIGVYAMGGAAIGSSIAIGAAAKGDTVIASAGLGKNILELTEHTTREEVKEFLLLHHPNIWKPLLHFITGFFVH